MHEPFEMHVVLGRVVLVVVDAHDERDVLVLRRRADDHLLRARLRCARSPSPCR